MKKFYFLSLLFMLMTFTVVVAQNTISAGSSNYKLPYKDTYIMQSLVTENLFRNAKPEMIKPKSFEYARSVLPNPYWEGHDEEISMYWKAWELAVNNICLPQENSGFVSSYITPAYNGHIFMWDNSFISMFCRYGKNFFPFQKTLNNFYAKQHPDGFICREIKADGADCFERYDPVSTGPNLLPWSEILYYEQYGDADRLNKVFPILCAYYKWLKLNRTWRNGTYWSSGWGSGMDNMPRVPSEYNTIYSNGHMIWLDACLQQIFMARILLKMGFYLERWQEIEEFEDEIEMLSSYINKNMWSEKDHFLYDQYDDGSLSSTKGVYAYWVLHTDVLPKDKLDFMVKELNNKETFNRPHRVASLAANNPKYKANGRYWVGGVWAPTNYMIITGLLKKGYRKLAYQIARNHYDNVFKVYKKTGTFWEYYSPENAEPGFMARKDFVGWTGLPPISELIEDIFGIRAAAMEHKLTIDVNLTEGYGISRYPFGKDGQVSIKVKKRSSKEEKPSITIDTNVSFELTVRWSDNKKIIVQVDPGNHTI